MFLCSGVYQKPEDKCFSYKFLYAAHKLQVFPELFFRLFSLVHQLFFAIVASQNLFAAHYVFSESLKFYNQELTEKIFPSNIEKQVAPLKVYNLMSVELHTSVK